MPSLSQQIKDSALSLNFSQCKICPADNLDSYQKHYQNFLDKKQHGEMDYLRKHQSLKTNPCQIVPNAKSIILVSLNYFQARKNANNWAPKLHIPQHREGQVARYAFGRDYHKVFRKKLKILSQTLTANHQNFRFFADSGPLLERQYAELSGLGYIGKNTMLISKKYGSWILLGEIITDAKLDYDLAFDRKKMVCGSCQKCQTACPTNALSQDYKIDASKCISYLTIEHSGSIPVELRPKIGNWLFGCDICQEVCPHNFRAKVSQEPDFLKPIAGESLNLKEILSIPNDETFTQKFAGSPLMRAKRSKLLRNACIVTSNLKRLDLLPEIQLLCQDSDPIIQEHAQWALKELQKNIPNYQKI